MARARGGRLDVVALTDHDTVGRARRGPAALPPGLTLVPGMELSCRWTGAACTCWPTCSTPRIPRWPAAARSATTGSRRARAMVGQAGRELGAAVTWEQVAAIAGDGVVGRPHIARALVDTGVVDSPADAFTADWIGDGGRAYEDRYALDPPTAIALVARRGGVTVLAHPPLAAGLRGVRRSDRASWPPRGWTASRCGHPDHRPDAAAGCGCWRPSWAWCPPAAATTTARSPAITSGPRPPRLMPSSASPPRLTAASRRYPRG